MGITNKINEVNQMTNNINKKRKININYRDNTTLVEVCRFFCLS